MIGYYFKFIINYQCASSDEIARELMRSESECTSWGHAWNVALFTTALQRLRLTREADRGDAYHSLDEAGLIWVTRQGS